MNLFYDQSPAFLQVLSSMCTNLSAAAIGYFVLTPQFIYIQDISDILVLLGNVAASIIFFRLAVFFQKKYES